MRPSPIYTKRFLVGELFQAATKSDRAQFARFHIDSINQLGKAFQSDFLTVNAVALNDKLVIDGELESAVAYTDHQTIASYQQSVVHDTFTPKTFSLPGSALFIEADNSMDFWTNQRIYRDHCRHVGFHWVLGVSYGIPNKKGQFLAIHYLRSIGEPFDPALSEEYVEYVSYPFVLGWLYQFGCVGKCELREWLEISAEATLPRFMFLRGLAGKGVWRAAELARLLNVKRKTIYRHTEEAYERLLSLGRVTQAAGNASRVMDLARQFQFLQYGSGDIERILPRRAS